MNEISERPKRLARFSQAAEQQQASSLIGVVGRRTGLQAPDNVLLSPTTGLADIDEFFAGFQKIFKINFCFRFFKKIFNFSTTTTITTFLIVFLDDTNSPAKVLLPFLLNVDFNSSETPSKPDSPTAKKQSAPLGRQVIVRNATAAVDNNNNNNNGNNNKKDNNGNASVRSNAPNSPTNKRPPKNSRQRSKFETKRKTTDEDDDDDDDGTTTTKKSSSSSTTSQQQQRILQPLKRSRLANSGKKKKSCR